MPQQPGQGQHFLGAEAGVGPDRVEQRVRGAAGLRRVQQDAAADGRVEEGGEEPLLARHAAEVRGAVEVPGPDVGQRGGAVQRAGAGRQVESRVTVLQRAGGAHPDAADLVDRAHEADEADFEVVVHAQPGQLLDRADHERGAAVRQRGVQLVGVRRVPPAAGLEVVRGQRGVGVARQADGGDPVPRLGHVQQQHRVRAAAGGAADVVPGAFLGAEPVA